MIPAEFDYVRASSVEEAVAALAEHGEDAKVLAGGQSLIPLLRLRFAFPSVLVDVGRVAAMKGVRDEGDRLVIGSATTHAEIIKDPLVAQHCPALAEVTDTVADRQVRHRGTIGGSLAHADPAGDLPALALALDAEMVVQGPRGERRVPASEFFQDYLSTALQPDEVLTAVSLPKLGAGWGYRYEKFQRTAQAWALVGVVGLVQRENGALRDVRVGLVNMGPTPLRATAVEQALAGASASVDSIAGAAEQAAEGTHPTSDLHADSGYRQHLARVLTRRALHAAAGL